MKLTSTLLILASAASAQTTTPKTSTTTRPAVHHTTTTARPAAACVIDGVPAILPAAIPKVTGPCAKTLFALRFVDTQIGTGLPIAPRKWLTVNYTGYLTDGTMFDSSIGTEKDGTPKKPISFPYGAHQVIVGWDTGFEGMNIGGKRRLYIPYQLAYGEAGRPPVIPAKSMLIFDVELVAISDTPPPQPGAPVAPPAKPTPPPASSPATEPAKPAATPPQPAATIPHI